MLTRPQPKTLMELGRCDCRWPVEGEGADTLFCGLPKKQFSSYCEDHDRCSRASKAGSND